MLVGVKAHCKAFRYRIESSAPARITLLIKVSGRDLSLPICEVYATSVCALFEIAYAMTDRACHRFSGAGEILSPDHARDACYVIIIAIRGRRRIAVGGRLSSCGAVSSFFVVWRASVAEERLFRDRLRLVVLDGQTERTDFKPAAETFHLQGIRLEGTLTVNR